MANQAVVGILRTLLTADTAQFDTSMRRAAQTTVKFGQETIKLTKQGENLAKAFGGDKILHSANQLTGAITKLGGANGLLAGAAKLTEAEQKRVNSRLTEAIAKYKALGQTAPASMIALATATKGASQPTDFLTTKMIALGAAVGTFAAQVGMQAVRALIGMARESFATASGLVDLAAKTRESLVSLQRMKFVADQTGTSFENFTNAAFMLRTRLAGGGLTVVKALEELRTVSGQAGLTVKSSADQILTALSAVTDSETQIRLGTELFGRSFKELSAAVAQGYAQMASAAETSTEAQLRALDRANDRWAQFKTNTSARIGGMMGELLRFGDVSQEVWAEVAKGTLKADDAEAEIQRRLAAGLDLRRQSDVALSNAAKFTATYVEQLRLAQLALDKLTSAQRAELAAAQQLGADQEEQIKLLSKWGIAAADAEGVLKLFTASMDAAKKSARELTQMQENNRLQIKRFAEILQDAAKAGVPLRVVLEEYGTEIDTAVSRAIIFKDEVPSAVMLASAAFLRLSMTAKEAVREMDFGAILRAGPDDWAHWGRVFDAIDQRQQQSLERRQSASIAAAEFDLALAERRGANERQLFALTESLERAKLDAALGAEEARFEIAQRGVNQQSELFKQLALGHQQTVDDLNHQWEIGVRRRAALFQSATEKMFRDVGGQLRDAFIGDLGTLFFGGIGHDPMGELKEQAQEAQLELLRLQRSGRATAKELQIAFDRWREAEDRANFDFGERFKQLWGGIKQTIVTVLNDILAHFVKSFIGGMLKAMAGAKLGQAFANALTGTAVASAIPGGVLTGATATGLTAATSLAGSTLPSFGASAGVLAAGTGVGAGAGTGSTAAAAGAGGGALGFLSNPAFWTNPWTIGVAGSIALGLAIWKKGLFRGGEEAVKVSPRRDRFFAQFGDVQNRGVGGANHNLAAILTRITGQDSGGPIFRALQIADSVKEWESAQSAAIAALANGGMRGIKSYRLGGFTPPGMTELALVHGGRFGELHLPLQAVASTMAPEPTRVIHHQEFRIYAMDGADVQRVLEREIYPRFNRETQLNQFGVGTAISRRTGGRR